MLVNLVVSRGPGKGRIFQIVRSGAYVLGRSERCQFCIPEDETVGRIQLIVTVSEQSRTVAVDAPDGMANPLFVNGRKISSTACIGSPSVVHFGSTRVDVTLEWDYPVAFQHCAGCGNTVFIALGLTHLLDRVLCEACTRSHGTTDRASARPDTLLAYHCRHCGADLMPEADSDGRAYDLRGAAEYSCPECLRMEEPVGNPAEATCIGDYVCLRALGAGGFGRVMLSWHRPTRRLVALKLLTELRGRDRFEREMRLLREFRHPNIVRFIDSGEDGGCYLAMQLVRGTNLGRFLLERAEPLPLDEALRLCSDVLSALAYLHCHPGGVYVHRDVKPDNILLAGKDSEPGKPHLTDFGLAKNVEGETRLTRLRAGMMGSVGYAPPEQIDDPRSAGPSADVYAAGVLLYYLLSGRFPFGYPSPMEVIRAGRDRGISLHRDSDFLALQDQLTDERGLGRNVLEAVFRSASSERVLPIPLREATEGRVAAALCHVVDRAVQRRPQDRFVDAGEMLTALHVASEQATP